MHVFTLGRRGIAAVIFSALLAGGAWCQSVRFVDAGADPGGDGQSWSTAYTDFEHALAKAADPNTDIIEIRVTSGSYKPSRQTDPNDPRTATFQLISGVAIYGGFPVGGGDWVDRDPNAHVSTLTGDLAGDDGPDFANYDENAYHVVTGSGMDSSAVLDGFTIRGGNANGVEPDERAGGGMFNVGGSPRVSLCQFVDNRAEAEGGGMANWGGSNPWVSRCAFADNYADNGGGVYNENSGPALTQITFERNDGGNQGGGVCNWSWSSPEITDCTFNENWARSGGGLANHDHSSPAVNDCKFTRNYTSAVHGGAMRNDNDCCPVIANCMFVENEAWREGGAIGSYGNSDVTATNCVFAGNQALGGAGFPGFGGGMSNETDSDPTVRNCIFIANSALHLGGGMSFWGNCVATISNCTFVANSADSGNGLGCGPTWQPDTLTVVNCILRDGSDEVYDNYVWVGGAPLSTTSGSVISIRYSNIEGGWPGEGNIDMDPVFADPNGLDGDPFTWEDNDYHLLAGSPCINAGDPNGDYTGQTDLDDEPRVLYARVDMGADEYSGPFVPSLVASDPPPEGTLPKTQENVILLTFDWLVELPLEPPLSMVPLAGGDDLGALLLCSIEPDGKSLRALEDGLVLEDQTWYRITPAASFNVQPFVLDLCTLRGDANNSARVTTADYTEVKAHMSEYTDARFDLNGTGRVTTADYSVVKQHMSSRCPPKP